MIQLSKTEEQLMHYLWKRKKAFLKDLLEDFPEPKPATTTVATLLKRVNDKGFIGYELFGKSREYFPLIKKTDYFSNHVNGLIKNFFNDSANQFASFFTRETDLTTAELEELKKVIDAQIKKQQR
jgi:BlaI family penicillinase repressor